jgi:SAM-dependent methyltransferase
MIVVLAPPTPAPDRAVALTRTAREPAPVAMRAQGAVGRALAPRRFRGVEPEQRAAAARRGPTGSARVARGGPTPTHPAAPQVRPLIGDGPRVDLVTVEDPQALSPCERLHADALVRELEAQARRALRHGHEPGRALENAERFPSLPTWLDLRGSALAVHALHHPGAARLAHGFSFQDLRAPRLGGGRSALDVLRAQIGGCRADAMAERVRAFCAAPMSDEARLLLAGSADGRALRQTALLAADAVARYRDRWGAGARIVAVGAGTGEGAAAIADRVGTRSLTLLDRDPLAVAAACAIHGDDIRATLVERDLATGLAAATGRGFDVVDLGGTLATLADPAAVALLRAARRALRPGGVLVASNMLAARPQATFFEHVVRWPQIMRRSPAQLAGLIAAAGIAQDVSLAVAAGAPLHVLATIDTAS